MSLKDSLPGYEVDPSLPTSAKIVRVHPLYILQPNSLSMVGETSFLRDTVDLRYLVCFSHNTAAFGVL